MDKVKMSLVGLDGNAFNLMGVFARNARQQGWTQPQIDKVLAECQQSDYNHLLQTLMAHIEEPDDVVVNDDNDEADEELV
jgi:hypothetical protein